MAVKELFLLAPGIPAGNARKRALEHAVHLVHRFPIGTHMYIIGTFQNSAYIYWQSYFIDHIIGSSDNQNVTSVCLKKYSRLKDRVRRLILFTNKEYTYVNIGLRAYI